QLRLTRARLLQRCDPVAERRQLFAELIVHLARDPPALVLLGEHEPGQELGALGALPLGEVEMRSDDADDRAAWLAANRKPAREDMYVSAVLVPQPELRLVHALAARDAIVRLVGAHAVVRMDEA